MLSELDKSRAFQEAEKVFKDFPQIFNDESQAEVTLCYDGREYRVDKIAKIDGETWIIDFKTGLQCQIIPQYRQQLIRYKNIYENINGLKTRAAILWTKTLSLVEVI